VHGTKMRRLALQCAHMDKEDAAQPQGKDPAGPRHFVPSRDRPHDAEEFTNKVNLLRYKTEHGKELDTLPSGRTGSGKLPIRDVAPIWFGARAQYQPALAGERLFEWLGWKWDPEKQGMTLDCGGRDILVIDKAKLLAKVESSSFRGFKAKAREAPGLRST
jgi:hypothetical protein